MSYDEAASQITAPGAAFETAQADIDGVVTPVFVNAWATLRDLFDSARGRADETFLVYEDERWAYGKVMGEIDGLAAAMVERYGVEKGDRVAIGMRNYPEWIVAWSAAISVGAIAVSLNAWWTSEELDFALRDSSPKLLVADVERVERAAAICQRDGIAVVAVRAEGLLDGYEGVDQWTDVVAPGATPPVVDLFPDDDATILYTSGTTGNPKGAVSTHRAVTQALFGFFARSTLDKAREAPEPAGDGPAKPSRGGPPVFILIVPLFHVTGCVPVMLTCFATGLKLVMMRKWDADRALELIERERVTNFVGVPTQSWDLLQSPRFGEFDTSSLRGVGGGGAPTPPELVRRVAGSFANAKPTIGYGMTETNAYGPQNGGDDYLSHPTSTGRVTPIMRIEARDADGTSLKTGETGELWMCGPNLIRGYWNNPEATAATIVDGWLRTGDIGHVDDEGFIYISDRAKDVVLRGGENVYCVEIENVLFEHPAIQEAAVFGVPDERLGEEVAAVVHLKAGVHVAAEDLTSFVATRLAPFKVPGVFVITDEPLPHNAAGKVLKRQLRERETERLSAQG